MIAVLAGAGCSADPPFSQYPGFSDYFRKDPPEPRAARPAERDLLRRYRPVLHVPADAPGPIDFYRDYIGHGELRAGGETFGEVTPELLAEHADDPEAVFRHAPPETPDPEPVAYGRVDHGWLEPIGRLTFVQWHFVFRHSGLPADLPAWQAALANTFADPSDWHQLDHYTAATLVLGPGEALLGVVLQQHNGLRAYWFGRDWPRPDDGRIHLAAAKRSNELYPWHETRQRHRVVRFVTADNIDWLATGAGERPWRASMDITVPGQRVDYGLRFLPGTDPFYRFQGYLGELRNLPGRSGPPGADYNTLPPLKDRVRQFCALRWGPGVPAERLDRLQRVLAERGDGGADNARRWLRDDCRAFVTGAIGYNRDPPSD